MMLPQRPYFPIGTLAAAVSYPAEPGTLRPRAASREADQRGRPARAGGAARRGGALEPDAVARRAAAARHRARAPAAPDFLFLDEATASLDEPAEAALYRLLQERLPDATIVSIGHRSTLAAFHRRRLALERDGGRYRVQRSGRCSRRRSDQAAARVMSGASARVRQRKRAAAPVAAARDSDGLLAILLQVGVDRQVGREPGDEAAAAPVRAEPARIDRSDAAACNVAVWSPVKALQFALLRSVSM